MKNIVKSIFKITIGCLLYSIGLAVFLKPNSIAPGGFSGFGIIINYLINIPVGTVILILNIPLWLIAFAKLGRYFMLTTIYAVVISSIMINNIGQLIIIPTEPLLASIYGGILLGLGLGLVFTVGSSTGGTDIITRLIRRKKPHLSLGQIMIYIDVVIISLGAFVFNDINSALYAVIALYISTKVIDSVIEGPDLAKLVYIISDYNNEIAAGIGSSLTRGSTFLNGKGTYTNSDKNVLMCAVRRHQIPAVKEIVKNHDEKAFMIVTDVREVLGYGFKIGGSNNEI